LKVVHNDSCEPRREINTDWHIGTGSLGSSDELDFWVKKVKGHEK